MAYVDLNPVRAAMEEDLFNSDLTSIQERLYDFVQPEPVKSTDEKLLISRIRKQEDLKKELGLEKQKSASLMGFDGSSHTSVHVVLPFTREDYFELVDATDRIIRKDKRGTISSKIPAIVARVGIDPNKWFSHIKKFGSTYGYCAGSVNNILEFTQKFERRWARGLSG